MVEPAIDALAGFSSFPPTAPRGSTGGADHAVPDGPRRATKSVTRSVRSVVSRFVLSPITTSGGRKILGICLHQAVIMTRPYRDVLVWLAGIQPPTIFRSLSEPSLVWLHRWPHTIGTRDWPRIRRSDSLNDRGRVPSPVIKIPMARNNVAVMDY